MHRRPLLPLASILCILLAGALAMGHTFVGSVMRGYESPDGGNIRHRYYSAGVASGSGYLTRIDWSGPLSFGIAGWRASGRWLSPANASPPIVERLTLISRVHNIPVRIKGGETGTLNRIMFPLWPMILPLLIPPLLWWRRRRRDCANAPGFPVEASPAESAV